MKILALSDQLEKRYPQVWNALTNLFKPVYCIVSRNIWCRDYMPVQTRSGAFVKFAYKGYGAGFVSYPWLKVPRNRWEICEFKDKLKISNIVLDGGNCTFSPDRSIVVMTDIIFKHNPKIAKHRLRVRLEKLLEAEVVLVPVEPGDDIGHTDGCMIFTPNGHGGTACGRMSPKSRPHVLLNDYRRMQSKAYQAYALRIENALGMYGIEFTHFTYAYHKCPNITEHMFRRQFPDADSCNPAYGYYVNMLVMDNFIVLPSFGIPEDKEALETVSRFFPHQVTSVDCRKLSMEGGLLNCITADYSL